MARKTTTGIERKLAWQAPHAMMHGLVKCFGSGALMHRTRLFLTLAIVGHLTASFFAVTAGCHLVVQHKDVFAPQELFRCETKIQSCLGPAPPVKNEADACAAIGCVGEVAVKCPLTKVANPAAGQCEKLARVDCYEPLDVVDTNRPTEEREIYCDRPAAIQGWDPALGEIAGATIIKTRQSDRNNNSESFLTLVLEEEMDVYLAYDSLAEEKPEWLEGSSSLAKELDFAKLKDQIWTTFRGDRNFDVYRKRDVIGKLEIPGNTYDNPKWAAGVTEKQRAMYFVMLKPSPTQSPTCNTHVVTLWEGCANNEDDARKEAEAACKEEKKQLYDWYECAEPSCEKGGPCVDSLVTTQKYSLTTQPRSFERHSEIDFKEPATLTVDKHKQTLDLSGHVDFEFLSLAPAKRLLKINSLRGSFGDSHGYKDLALHLGEPAYAECQDLSPKRPCKSYLIPEGAFRLVVTGTKDGSPVISYGKNRSDLEVTIKKPVVTKPCSTGICISIGANYVLTLEGPVIVPVENNGTPTDLVMNLTVKGEFTNFDPVANAKESDRFVPCARERSAGNVSLIAMSDADVGETPTFTWYEDFGLSTQRYLESGSQVVLPPGKFGWGVHHITLVVEDLRVRAMDPFELNVADTEPPFFVKLPDDIFVAAGSPAPGASPRPVKVNLGQPAVKDKCSEAVVTFSDAPEDGKFFPGVTEVTWYADDQHGNVIAAQSPQLVCVYDPAAHNPRDLLGQLGTCLHSGIGGMQLKIANCDPDDKCDVNAKPLQHATAQLQALLAEQFGQISADDRDLLEAKLKHTKNALNKAAKLLSRSNRAKGTDRATLRQTAAELLDSSRSAVKAIVNHPALEAAHMAPDRMQMNP